MRDTPTSPDAPQPRAPFATPSSYPPYQSVPGSNTPLRNGRSARQGASERRRTPWFAWPIGGCLGILAIITLGVALIAGLVGGLLIKLSQEQNASAQTTSTYVVSGAPTVVAQNTAGSITFRLGESGQVIVTVARHARDATSDSAQQDIQQIQVATIQQGATITVVAHFSGSGALGAQRSVDMTITVPPMANIRATIGAGDITANGVSGVMQINSGAGTLTLNQVTLANGSQVTDSAGTINITGTLASGASVSVRNDAGDINVTLPPTTATIINARTSAGHITVNGWNLTLSHDGFGATARAIGKTASNAKGVLSLQTNAGNITLTAGG